MNESLEREIAELTALTAPRQPDEACSNAQSAPNPTLRASWLQLADLLEAASVESPPRNKVSSAEPQASRKSPLPIVSRKVLANKLPTEQRWGVWAVAGSLLFAMLAVGANLPSVRQNPLAPLAENARLRNRNSVAADASYVTEAPQVKPNAVIAPDAIAPDAATPEAASGDDVNLAWDNDLDDAIASAEIAVWSFESNARPAEQAFRWVDTQIQQLGKDFQDNSL